MARKPRVRAKTSRSRFNPIGWLWRIFALGVLATIIFAAWLWIDMRSWRPDEARYPEQGVVIASGATGTRFETLKALGAQFVYLELASADGPPDPGFAQRLAKARQSGLKVGILQPFDPCLRADPQSARYTRMVPRDGDLLPPALELDTLPTRCNPQVSAAAVESEVLTLINQIEMHAAKPLIIKISQPFEMKFGLARSMERDLWLMRERAEPRYAGRPWLLWSANQQLRSEASNMPLEWVVVQR